MISKFKLIEINDNDLTYETDTGTQIKATASQLVESNRIKLFNREDREKIRKASGLYHIENGRFVLWFGLVAVLYIVSILASTGLSLMGREFEFLGGKVAFGSILYSLSFVFLDSLSATIGYRYARAAVLVGLVAHVFLSATVFLSGLVFEAGEYAPLVSQVVLMLLGGGVAVAIGDQANNLVFRHFAGALYKRPLWFRAIVSTVCGQLVCSAIWIYTTVSHAQFLDKFVDNYLLKIVACVALVPLTYALVGLYNRHILGHKKREMALEKARLVVD